MYAKVSKKGQVTIPKAIREQLDIKNDGAVIFVVENGEVKIKGVPRKTVSELAGSLNKYSKGYKPLKDIRKEIKSKIAKAALTEGIGD
jgi:AbrB family looped-hinge helix DNA binding protein